jgi:2,3-bisphosphoglycerate-independent phosphoglycerate mutase
MSNFKIDDLVIENQSKIIYLILDGVGGLSMEGNEGTELQLARTPHLDALAEKSICGLLDPIMPGVTPGSGPSHFALFGYDPLENNIGRGVLEAAGIDFPLTSIDIVARINYATANKEGIITDRRAGRISSEENKRICAKLEQQIDLGSDIEVLVRPVKEHRAVLVIRSESLEEGDIEDTDPQREGLAPLAPKALNAKSEKTVEHVKKIIDQSFKVLSDEPKANALLLRGFSRYRLYPSLMERFKLRSIAIATYPMYKGIARLLGMKVLDGLATLEDEIKALQDNYDQYDFFYLHVKQTDSRGEDGDFAAKVKVIEEADKIVPQITQLNPDVMVVTGDHSTPAKLKSHSWHPLPVLINSRFSRIDNVKNYDEISCAQGGLGRIATINLMSLSLAHSLRLAKYGA